MGQYNRLTCATVESNDVVVLGNFEFERLARVGTNFVSGLGSNDAQTSYPIGVSTWKSTIRQGDDCCGPNEETYQRCQ